MVQLKGKNAFITGSSRGIGQQIALGLASLGCNVIVHGRTKESCSKTLELLQKYRINSYGVFGELSNVEQIKEVISQVKAINIPIDILYNNAAKMTSFHENYWEHSRKEWMDTYNVNVFAVYDLCAAFVPAMIENNFGRVVNLSSGIKDQPELAPYSTSKWAINKLTNDLAFKLKDTNVRINAIDPGWIRTDMGGENAEHAVEAVLPGILAPVLIENDGLNGELFSAIEHDINLEDFNLLMNK